MKTTDQKAADQQNDTSALQQKIAELEARIQVQQSELQEAKQLNQDLSQDVKATSEAKNRLAEQTAYQDETIKRLQNDNTRVKARNKKQHNALVDLRRTVNLFRKSNAAQEKTIEALVTQLKGPQISPSHLLPDQHIQAMLENPRQTEKLAILFFEDRATPVIHTHGLHALVALGKSINELRLAADAPQQKKLFGKNDAPTPWKLRDESFRTAITALTCTAHPDLPGDNSVLRSHLIIAIGSTMYALSSGGENAADYQQRKLCVETLTEKLQHPTWEAELQQGYDLAAKGGNNIEAFTKLLPVAEQPVIRQAKQAAVDTTQPTTNKTSLSKVGQNQLAAPKQPGFIAKTGYALRGAAIAGAFVVAAASLFWAGKAIVQEEAQTVGLITVTTTKDYNHYRSGYAALLANMKDLNPAIYKTYVPEPQAAKPQVAQKKTPAATPKGP